MRYEDLHDGARPPTPHPLTVYAYAGRASVFGQIDALSYATKRASKSGIWRHEFDQPPALLIADPDGPFRITVDGLPELVGLGLLVDVELTDGSLMVASAVYVGTDASGAVWLVSHHPIEWAIEPVFGVRITERGIEG